MRLTSEEDFLKEFPIRGTQEEQIQALLTAAMRAPSTHNSQPWRFKITGNTVAVYRDTSIKLPESDPVNRYAHVSIGFLLHHLVTIAKWLGMQPRITLIFSGDKIAEIQLVQANPSQPSELVRAIFTRRNRRGVFLPEQIPQQVLSEATHPPDTPFVPADVRVIIDQAKIMQVADATADNMLRVYKRPAFRREMSRWITPTGSSRATGLPGYSLNQPVLLSWILPTVIYYFNTGKILAKLNRSAIASASAVFGFGSSDDARGWVAVGYAASHAALTLTARGYDYSVFVASIEYPDTRSAIGTALGLSQPLEFLFAAGKLPGKVQWLTPRVPLEAKMLP